MAQKARHYRDSQNECQRDGCAEKRRERNEGPQKRSYGSAVPDGCVEF